MIYYGRFKMIIKGKKSRQKNNEESATSSPTNQVVVYSFLRFVIVSGAINKTSRKCASSNINAGKLEFIF